MKNWEKKFNKIIKDGWNAETFPEIKRFIKRLVKQKWEQEFPKKEGWYWFYGYRFKRETEKELCIVKVRKISNGFIYVCNGNFMFEKETGKGKFISAMLPELPKG